ncbi:MAG TPA: tetratricopeptide repeat protein [Pyrinomonadaceae bacterium]|jgi:tetratricopeptide (TPR) repeat protein|nr:tetratricopeptide repeat protein [Pyrinomonadaceae bacterium]
MFDEDFQSDARLEAVELFRRAYQAQTEKNYDEAIELYRRSIAAYPTAEAHTFLGWAYSFKGRYADAIDECLEAIRVDSDFGNPYNDIGSYLIAQGDLWTCVRWFERAIVAPRYEARAFPHYNLASVYERRGRLLDAARHYGLALEEQPDYAQAAKALRRLQSKLN